MTPSDDDQDVPLPRRLDDRAADALLSGRAVDDEAELSAFVAEVRALTQTPAPAPSAALAAMLEAGLAAEELVTVPLPAPRRVRSWSLALQLGLAGAACCALVLGAAAANELPDPAQTAVADVVEMVTPLHLPRPTEPADAPRPAVTPTAPVTPAPQTPTPHAQPTVVGAQPDDIRDDREDRGRTGSAAHDEDRSEDRRDDGRPSPRPSAQPTADDNADNADTDGSDGTDGPRDERSGDGPTQGTSGDLQER